ncbi:MAG: ABC transporter ATP-binding protein [Pseudomonadota bacterium]
MSAVDAKGVNKFYGDVAALDDVSLNFPDGSFYALLGPSGSGKTTLLRAIAGFVEPDSGEITIDGVSVEHIPAHRRNIGMVFQNYALFPHMTVYDNVAFGLSVRSVSKSEIADRVRQMLELVQLAGMEERKPRQLSGGQQQRIALARALVTDPKVLLLDEPLGALDKRLRQDMQIELRQIQRKVGITTIFVTHDQEEALTLADRIAIINEGKLVQVGEPDDIYEHPRTRFAASFLGDANFIEGKSVGQGEVGQTPFGTIRTSGALPVAGAAVTLAVRPEKFHVSAGDPAPGTMNALTGTVRQAVYSGSSVTYLVEAGSQEFRVFQQNRETSLYQPGESVSLTWSPEHTVVVE